MSYGKRVFELRKKLNLTLEKFGEPLGVTKTAISRIEKEERTITDQMAKAICREYNVNEEWLRTGDGEMFIKQTRDEEIADFIGSIQMTEDDSFKKRLISMLAKLTEEQWEMLADMAENLTKEKD